NGCKATDPSPLTATHPRGENDALEPGRAGRRSGGSERPAIVADHMILRSPLAWLHRLRATPRSTELEVTAHPRRYAIEQPSFLEDAQRVGVGGRIGG